MTKTAETQINTALALAQLVQSKDAGRGCRLSAERTKALWHFISLLMTSSVGEEKAGAGEAKSNGPESLTDGPDPFASEPAQSDAAAGAGDLLAATGE